MKTRKASSSVVRLDQEVTEKLEGLAEREKTSAKFLANRALERYVHFEVVAEEFNLISIAAATLSKLISYLTTEEARKLGRWHGENVLRPFTMLWFGKESLESAVASLEKFGLYTGRYDSNHEIDGSNLTIILRHSLAPKWSLFYEEMVKTMLDAYLNRDISNVIVNSSESQVVAEITIKPKSPSPST